MARKELALFSDLDRFFDRPPFDRSFFGRDARWPSFRSMIPSDMTNWVPQIDVLERGNALVTKIDLPGMKKEDVRVEVTDGHLAISGERKSETEETKDNVYRAERSFGSFYRAIPLPEGVKLEDVKAAFTDGVLEVSLPLPAKAEPKARQVPIQEGAAEKAAGGARS